MGANANALLYIGDQKVDFGTVVPGTIKRTRAQMAQNGVHAASLAVGVQDRPRVSNFAAPRA